MRGRYVERRAARKITHPAAANTYYRTYGRSKLVLPASYARSFILARWKREGKKKKKKAEKGK